MRIIPVILSALNFSCQKIKPESDVITVEKETITEVYDQGPTLRAMVIKTVAAIVTMPKNTAIRTVYSDAFKRNPAITAKVAAHNTLVAPLYT